MQPNTNRPLRRDALKLTAAGLAASAFYPTSLATQLPKVAGPRTEVRPHLGKPTFFVDGQPYTKPVFETYVPETRFFRQFSEAGTDVFCFATNLGSGFAAPTWKGPDDFDFKQLDERVQRVLQANPKGLLLPRIYLTTPQWWIDANPDECQQLSDGGKRYRVGVGHGRDNQSFPSLASAKWRNDTATALQRVIQHLQQSDAGPHLFGYVLTGLMSEEWYHWSIHSGQLSDYSSHALFAFRDWLRAKYQTVNALRRAWHNPQIDFENVAVPSQADRESRRNLSTFRDPVSEMPVIDWYLFYNDLVPDTMEVFLQAAKVSCDFAKVIGAFYCYMFEFGGDPEYGHNALTKLLRSKHLDFAMVTASYHGRGLGHGADYARAPITSVSLHGKLWYHDNDTVSFRYDEMNRASPDRETVERYRKELGVTETVQETIWQYRRGAGFVLGNGIYQSFFDLHGGYFDDPELMAEIKRLNQLLDESKQYDCSSAAEILVVSDEVSCSFATFESGFLQQTLQPLQVQLAKVGAPHDSILIDDLELAEMSRYKLVIFLNCFHLNDLQRERIHRQVLGNDRTVLWSYAPGLFSESTSSISAASELTGIRIVAGKDSERARMRIVLNEAGAAMFSMRARDDSAGPADSLRSEMAKQLVGHEHVWGQLFSVEDAQAVSLGCVEGRDEVALAMKRMKNWTSFYTLNPVLPSFMLRALAIQAGVHIFNDRDDTFYAGRSYACLNADGPGVRTLRFSNPADLFDPFTGSRIAQQVSEYACQFKDKETLLIRYSGRDRS